MSRVDGPAQPPVSHPFVRLKDHPSVPTCPPRGVAAGGGQGWLQGHRASRRAASLRAVRGNAKLWKGEDISGLLLVHNGSSNRKSPPSMTRISCSYVKRTPRSCGCAVRNQGHLAWQSG